MAERWEDRRRRIAVFLVALVAAAATIATSPARIESRLDRSSSASVVLADDTPRAVGRFVLTIAPEALPLGTQTAPTPTGTVSFAIKATGVGTGGAGAGPGGPVQITASAVDISVQSQLLNEAPSWQIDELCRVAEPCRREFEVSVEWLRPQAGTSITVPVEAALHVLYDRWEAAPVGATATWENAEFTAVAPAPALSAKADLGSVVLGRDSPMAARHVLLRGSATLLADPATADVTAYVRSALTAGQPPQAVVTLVPDDARDLPPVDAGAFIQPFAGCPRAQECVRGYTILARWVGQEPDAKVGLDWSFDAVARFPVNAGVPANATLTTEVDQALDLGLASPRLQTRSEGTFELLAAGNRKGGRVRLQVTAPALGNAFFGAAPPAVALVRLHAVLKDPDSPADLRAWVTAPDRPGVSALALAGDGTELQTIALPLAGCRETPRCTGYVEIFVESTAGRDATISWDVAVELALPRPELATGELTIEVTRAP